jgi:hypothetical protein
MNFFANFWVKLIGFTGLCLLILAVLFLRKDTMAIAAIDAPPHLLNRIHEAVNEGNFSYWITEPWLGSHYGAIAPDHNALIYLSQGFPKSLTLLIVVNLLIGGIGMFILLRTLQLPGMAAAFGGLCFLLTNTVVTLVYPGHVNKIMSSAWIPFSVSCFFLAQKRRQWFLYLFCGAFLGLSLLGGEVQLPFYQGIWFGFFTILSWFHLKKEEGVVRSITSSLGGLGLIGLTALVVGASTTIHSIAYYQTVNPVVSSSGGEDNWKFATQFYFPPEEILSYLTTIQFFGAPHVYWGRDGDPTPIRLSDDYMGLLPLILAIIGAVKYWDRKEVRLLTVMGVGALLISFGRDGGIPLLLVTLAAIIVSQLWKRKLWVAMLIFFASVFVSLNSGLFWLLYQLPTMKSQRNPHRWSYFVSLAVCILAAYGIAWLWKKLEPYRKSAREASKKKTSSSGSLVPWASKAKRWLLILSILGGLTAIVGSVLMPVSEIIAQNIFNDPKLDQNQLPLLTERVYMALASYQRTGLFLALSAGAVFWLLYSHERLFRDRAGSSWAFYVPMALVFGVTALDLGMNAKRYIHFYDWKARLQGTDVIQFLKKDGELFRVKITGTHENNLLNELAANVLPYHGIQVVDPVAMSRIPADYQGLFKHIEDRYVSPQSYYDYFNIKYIITTKPISDPSFKVEKVAEGDGFMIYERKSFLPRAWLAPAARVVPQESVLSQTFHPSLNFRETVILEEPPQQKDLLEPSNNQPVDLGKPGRESSPQKANSGFLGSAQVKVYRENYVEIGTSSEKPSILVFGDKWDPNWKVTVNGRDTKLLKANHLMRGVELPAGSHHVVMDYAPPQMGQRISGISVAVLLPLMVLYGVYSLRKGRREEGPIA